MQVWNVLEIGGHTGRENGAKNRHLRTIALLCRAMSSPLRNLSTIWKDLLSSNICPSCPYNTVNFGHSGWDRFVSLGHPSKFQRDSRLGSVTAQPHCMRRWTDGATCIRQGGHHVGHWPRFLVFFYLPSIFYSSPNLSRRMIKCLPYFHTWCGHSANLRCRCAARGSLEIQDAKMMQKIAICAPSHNFVGLYLRNWGTYQKWKKTC